MSQDSPSIEEILITLKEFADDVAARSEGAERYDALCAGFLAEVVRRESADDGNDQLAAKFAEVATGGGREAIRAFFDAHIAAGDDDPPPASGA